MRRVRCARARVRGDTRRRSKRGTRKVKARHAKRGERAAAGRQAGGARGERARGRQRRGARTLIFHHLFIVRPHSSKRPRARRGRRKGKRHACRDAYTSSLSATHTASHSLNTECARDVRHTVSETPLLSVRKKYGAGQSVMNEEERQQDKGTQMKGHYHCTKYHHHSIIITEYPHCLSTRAQADMMKRAERQKRSKRGRHSKMRRVRRESRGKQAMHARVRVRQRCRHAKEFSHAPRGARHEGQECGEHAVKGVCKDAHIRCGKGSAAGRW